MLCSGVLITICTQGMSHAKRLIKKNHILIQQSNAMARKQSQVGSTFHPTMDVSEGMMFQKVASRVRGQEGYFLIFLIL